MKCIRRGKEFIEKKYCDKCGKELTNYKRKYCEDCRGNVRYHDTEHKKPKICRKCGCEFIPSKKQLFYCKDCQENLKYERREERTSKPKERDNWSYIPYEREPKPIIIRESPPQPKKLCLYCHKDIMELYQNKFSSYGRILFCDELCERRYYEIRRQIVLTFNSSELDKEIKRLRELGKDYSFEVIQNASM